MSSRSQQHPDLRPRTQEEIVIKMQISQEQSYSALHIVLCLTVIRAYNMHTYHTAKA